MSDKELIAEKKMENAIRELSEKKTQHRYYLQNYLYSGQEEVLAEASRHISPKLWDLWHCAIMIESAQPFFDMAQEDMWKDVEKELHRRFFYLNLNTHQSLLLFYETYCDYTLVAQRLYVYLKQKYTARFYLAVSRQFESSGELPDILGQLQMEMKELYYLPDVHVFTSEEDKEKKASEETQDSQLVHMISEDIRRRDGFLLRKHFDFLAEKYHRQTQFSAMYVKFVFSSVIQELFQDRRFTQERNLEQEIDSLYATQDIGRILEITRQAITEYELYLERRMQKSIGVVDQAESYLRTHYAQDLNMDQLAERVRLPGGYLNAVFEKKTGMNLYRCIKLIRMKKARELLTQTDLPIAQISSEVGYMHVPYFCRAFHEYYGIRPEDARCKE